MKKLMLLAAGVGVALVGFIAVLYFLPCNGGHCGYGDHCMMNNGKNGRWEMQWKDASGKMHKQIRVEMRGDGMMNGCDGDEDCMMGNGGMQGNCPMGNGGMMNGSYSAHGMMNGKSCPMGDSASCGMHGKMNMQMGGCGMQMMHGGCCCCCCRMMCSEMMEHCTMGKSDSMNCSMKGDSACCKGKK